MTRQADATKRDTLTLEEAARRLGVSLRTVQRRIKDGDLSTVERDGARLVCLAPDATEAATRDATRRDNDATPRQIGATKPDSEATARADLLAQLRTENEYLKKQVDAWRLQTEAANRTANETAAAMRELLKSQPRAITGGEVGSTPTVENQSREDAPQAARSGEVGQPARSTPNVARKPQRTAWQRMAARILGVRL